MAVKICYMEGNSWFFCVSLCVFVCLLQWIIMFMTNVHAL